MERTTCTLIYYLRKTRIDKEGKAPIYVRLTVNGQRAEVCARPASCPGIGFNPVARLWKTTGKAVRLTGCWRPSRSILRKRDARWRQKGKVRDIFCFCCLTGLAFTDVQQLKAEHRVADIHGKIWIRKARQKTKNMCNIPLLDEAQKILDRYRDHPYCQTHGVLLPVCSNQKMNSYLKELADICGIRKNISTHCARQTGFNQQNLEK